MPVVTDRRQPIELQRQVQIGAGTLAFVGTVLGLLVSPWFLVVPLFVGAGLIMAGVTGFCGMARLLMRAPWNKAAYAPSGQARTARSRRPDSTVRSCDDGLILGPNRARGRFSGSLVGFSLGLVGGGGSILAVPLLVYVVGLDNPHLAIGTSAIAVAVNAAANLSMHARSGNVKWRCASVSALAGVAGAFLGSTLGKMMDGQKLLALFAVLMIVVSVLMLRGRAQRAIRACG